MGRYVAPADLGARFGEGELIDLAPATDGAEGHDTAAVEAAIGDAEAAMDGYLRSRYALPLAEVPPELTAIAADLARYELRARAGGINQSTMSDDVVARRDRAIQRLKDIQAGKFVLDVGGASGGGSQPATDRVGLAAGDTPLSDSPEFRAWRERIGGGS